MELQFMISGSLVCRVPEADCVPAIGSAAVIRTSSYKKGVAPGSLLRFPISSEYPPIYDYSEDGRIIVYIDVNGYDVIEEGPDVE